MATEQTMPAPLTYSLLDALKSRNFTAANEAFATLMKTKTDALLVREQGTVFTEDTEPKDMSGSPKSMGLIDRCQCSGCSKCNGECQKVATTKRGTLMSPDTINVCADCQKR